MRMLSVAASVAMLVACLPERAVSTPVGVVDPSDPPIPDDPPPDDPPPDDPPPDADGDGLTDDEENDVFHTDPNNPDSDGDGWTDSDEIWNQNTDPNDSTDNPDANVGSDCSGIVATGNGVGQIAENFSLTDQNGNQVHLHDHCESLVVLVASASWCGPCQDVAPDLQALYAQYESQGLVVMTLLGEGDVVQWSSRFGLQHPVLIDPDYAVTERFTQTPAFSIPNMQVIGPGSVVLLRDSFLTESEILAYLP